MAVSKSWLYMEVGSQLMAVYTCEHHPDSYIKRLTELVAVKQNWQKRYGRIKMPMTYMYRGCMTAGC
jgi:hypothetical protein